MVEGVDILHLLLPSTERPTTFLIYSVSYRSWFLSRTVYQSRDYSPSLFFFSLHLSFSRLELKDCCLSPHLSLLLRPLVNWSSLSLLKASIPNERFRLTRIFNIGNNKWEKGNETLDNQWRQKITNNLLLSSLGVDHVETTRVQRLFEVH